MASRFQSRIIKYQMFKQGYVGGLKSKKQEIVLGEQSLELTTFDIHVMEGMRKHRLQVTTGSAAPNLTLNIVA